MIYRTIILNKAWFLLLPFLLFLSSCEKKTSEDGIRNLKAKTPDRTISWVKKQEISGLKLDHLSMAWNGSSLLFSASEKKVTTDPISGQIMIGISQNKNGSFTDWRVNNPIKNLFLAGSGSQLLIETEDNRVQFYRDWHDNLNFITLDEKYEKAVLAPTGKWILAEEVVDKNSATGTITIFTDIGKIAGTVTTPSARMKYLKYFPFLSHHQRWLLISEKGEITYYDGDKLIWRKQLVGNPGLVASSFLEGGQILFSTDQNPSRLSMFNDLGEVTANAEIEGEVVSLACSKLGGNCAVLSRTKENQMLSFLTKDLKNIFSYETNTVPGEKSKVVIADQGKIILAGMKEKSGDYIYAWNESGMAQWKIKLKEGLRDFVVSWDGKWITVLTKNNQVLFYDNHTKIQTPPKTK
ncbi:MAG: hypothetical protein OEY59_02875 [Deltaproteobacteria bacterium]|nr:hypothetical protein [Deltaproteobacteria bacterium]